MHNRRPMPLLIAALFVLASCGGNDDSTPGDPATSGTIASTTIDLTTTIADSTTIAATTSESVTTVEATTTTEMVTTSTTEFVEAAQPAVWPASDVVFETPEEAAADFISTVFGIEPLLGEFREGDSRSGEIEVLSPGDDDDPSTVSPTGVMLLLRRLGSDDGWFVMAAVSDGVSITSPESTAEVAAGPLPIEGLARGHEGNVLVSAFVAGDAHALDDDFTMAGLITPEPYTVTLDVSAAAPGDVVALLVRGDTGLEGVTGEFATIPLSIRVGARIESTRFSDE